VGAITGCDAQTASDSFDRSGSSTKVAILLASGASGPESARALLQQSGQALRPALQKLHETQNHHNCKAPDGASTGAAT
jgi:N-acetylmuramic acid 6-phosphate etherase